MRRKQPPQPVHIRGAAKGEETAMKEGREPGRADTVDADYRTARDSTGIDSEHRGPIDSQMPNIPPA